ncbi:hypothetical protein B0J13DRAFT_618682 [Dactylonectria estremocensis]|uniref:Uncharacterized protein n=1 Tax=Dactylonectria estremocensis TaxID=1079267 RepID=A0A9P9F6V7_9HYPO|nr:hypothetical protein B0J13DRAFT_618682 [Dactylonectria estremocensis]
MPVLNLTATAVHSYQRRKQCDELAATGYTVGLIILGLLTVIAGTFALWYKTNLAHSHKDVQEYMARCKDHRDLAKKAKTRFNLMLQMAHEEKAVLEKENQKLRRQICRIPTRVRTPAEKTRERNNFPTAAAPADKKPDVVMQQKQQKSKPTEDPDYWGVYDKAHPVDFVDITSPTRSMYCSGGSGDDHRGRAKTHQANETSGRQSRQSSRKPERNRQQKSRSRSQSQTPSERKGPSGRARCLTISTTASVKATTLPKPPVMPEAGKGLARTENTQRARLEKAKKSEIAWPFLGDDQEDLESHALLEYPTILVELNKLTLRKDPNE